MYATHLLSLLAAAAAAATAQEYPLANGCSGGEATQQGGNYYCREVQHIQYRGFAGRGSYDEVVDMPANGSCSFRAREFQGSLAPLDEDLSVHVRGPVHLKAAAVYTLTQAQPQDQQNHLRIKRHPRLRHPEWVTAVIDGQTVSWVNNWFGPTPVPDSDSDSVPAPPPDPTLPVEETTTTTVTKTMTITPLPAPKETGGAVWRRVAHYDAESQSVDNMRFLGNYGGQQSGVWSEQYGNSLAYLSADGHSGSASPEILQDKALPSNHEFAIFSAEKCDESCGFSRAQNVSYKGFGGANKIFLLRFSMPSDGDGNDMPAIWLLNGRIPRTVQYGDCSCWSTRCGEVDVFEALETGGTKCKSTFHLSRRGGSSDWFKRPTDRYITVAVIFHHDTASVTIKILPDYDDFAESIDDFTVHDWMDGGEESTLFEFNGS
ncbi:hypothetical protein CDD80_3095 [Ophiocordyceps camponoti-rufipedis]|uniref:glucan endo-1,3-beta-D-glucosidase n=1 Tax=Ophiocordyceps camponoti-rufipedis TaxID=2004952 RepID=A0A2C5Z3Z4_9HYPO|nr:hypothetical protein CDD80_3095 [Ophiocordyceps camponoti-rufipedis]